MRHPVAITGMHRSGTSMITRNLHESGLHLLGGADDELIEAAEDNPEGFWENKAIVACNDEILEATGGAWDNPPDVPARAADDPRVAHVVDDAVAALDGLREHDHWGFKDPRVCLTAPFWLDLEPDLHVILCVRHPLEVALSLKRRNQNSYSLGLSLWERYYTALREAVPAERLLVTHYETFFHDPGRELARLCAFAGLEPAEPGVREDLRHYAIDVDLTDAGVSDSVRDLYAELCERAGVPIEPARPTDEGRVRRLVLDGAVAARHAEQRQTAIDRLKEREEELRARIAEVEGERRRELAELESARRRERAELEQTRRRERAELEHDSRARTRELEAKLSTATGELRTMHADALRTAEELRGDFEATNRRLDQLERDLGGAIERVDAFITTPQRAVRKAKRAGENRLIRPVRRVLGRTKRAASPRVRALQHRLPPPGDAALRSARRAARGGPRAAVTELESAAKQMPPPAQRALRTARGAGRRARARVDARRSRPGSRPVQTGPRPHRGPAFKGWKESFAELAGSTVAPGRGWLVVQPGSPQGVRGVRSPAGTPFPQITGGEPMVDDLAHIAHLEALRFEGHDRLLVPEGSRDWFRDHVLLRDHLVGTCRTVADVDDAGVAFDLAAPPDAGVSSLRAAVEGLCPAETEEIAVLDWTTLDVAGELPGLATFRPPVEERLPYLYDSVPVVVVERTRDLVEPIRVATRGVVVVDASEGGAIEVVEVRSLAASEVAPAPHVLVVSADPDDDAGWRAALGRRAHDAGAEVRFAPIDAAGIGEVERHDVVVVVEPYVLPLPGSLRSAADHALADPQAAVSGKVVGSDGILESAGGTVFADRSVALVGHGSADVRAPWHDYTRPVCWSPGSVAASAELWNRTPRPELVHGAAFLREWCSEVWGSGGSVRYHPDVTSVRVRGDGGEASTPLRESSWQRVLDLRPQRPTELSEGAWRYLLARDDVESCRR